MMETKNFQKYLLFFFIIIRCTLQINSDVHHVIRDFVDVQSKCQHTKVNFSLYVR